MKNKLSKSQLLICHFMKREDVPIITKYMYKKEELSKNLLNRCQVCCNGGRNIFPDCLDFNPITDCYYFDDINDDDPREEDYDCGAYMHIDDYNELKGLTTNEKKN